MRSLTACLVLAAAVGCGSDGGSPQASPSPTPMTKAAYVTAANAICARTTEKMDAVPEPTTAAEYVTAATQLIAAADAGQRELRVLTPPVADRTAIETNLLGVNDQQVQVLKDVLPALQAAAGKNDTHAAETAFSVAADKLDALSTKQQAWGHGYGLDDCVD